MGRNWTPEHLEQLSCLKTSQRALELLTLRRLKERILQLRRELFMAFLSVFIHPCYPRARYLGVSY